ncbi:hypothetical protein SSCG_03642 [Streptomyces clavuligerus]|nr:hypothetical protein SSCG_03642 [Streptomyces clavuligerus]
MPAGGRPDHRPPDRRGLPLRTTSETCAREQSAHWWTAGQATDTAIGSPAALRATSAPPHPGHPHPGHPARHRRDARATVSTGKLAIYQITGNRLT